VAQGDGTSPLLGPTSRQLDLLPASPVDGVTN